jgi:protein SCO1/2
VVRGASQTSRSALLGTLALVAIALPGLFRRWASAGPELPHLGRVPTFALRDQRGQAVGPGDLAGSPWVVDFVFTGCSEACPRLSARMAELDHRLKTRGVRGHLVSITIDPANDTPERLAAYAARLGADPDRWRFLTGPADAIERAVVDGFKQGIDREAASEAAGGFTLVHGNRFVLVDARGEIRGYYDALADEGLSALERDLAALQRRGGA